MNYWLLENLIQKYVIKIVFTEKKGIMNYFSLK